MSTDNCKKSANQVAMEYWCDDHRLREPEGVMTDWCSEIFCWRIGWALGVHEVIKKKAKGCHVLRFFKNIESGERWQCGLKSARSAAPDDCRRSINIYDPIVFKHAAWLLGWFDGYKEQHEDVHEKHKECKRKGYGLGKGRDAARLYLYKLCELGWIHNPEIKRLLGIPSDS